MILKNIKAKDQGFTIVELLVVIVVIGILAAITIVSYTGITARANTSANKQNASSVVAAAQTYYADNSSVFPATSGTSATVLAAFVGGNGNVAKLPAGLTITNATVTSTNPSYLSYRLKGTTGICVGYWDFTGAGSAQYLFGGDATADNGTCS